MSLQIRLLGFVQIYVYDRLIPIKALKRLALIAALAFSCNQPVSLEDLTEAVWGADPPTSAAANLRNYASSLRRILGGRITTVAGGYQLSLAPGERDVDEFQRLARQGRAALAGGDPVIAERVLSESLTLWRGPAGQGLRTDTSLGFDLAGLEEQRMAVQDELVEVRLQLGHHREVIPMLRKHLHQHPLRERSWAQLMLALYRDGDTAGALQAYAAARAAIRTDLGIEPGPQLTGLHRAILARSSSLGPGSLLRLAM